MEEVEGLDDEAFFDELLSHRFTNAIDVESFSLSEVLDASDCLSWALEADATPCYEALFLYNGATTGWTLASDVIVEGEGGVIMVALVGEDLDDSGNDFASLLDDDSIADADILTLDFLFIMQGRAGDR